MRAGGLWECPRCGAKLVSRNLSHACGPYSVEAFVAGKGANARKLFDRFVELIATCGEYHLAPAKTRVAFLAQVRFASVNALTDDRMDLHFVLPVRLRSSRFRKVEQLGKLYVHHMRVTAVEELDAELQGWLQKSYTEYGERRWLRRRG